MPAVRGITYALACCTQLPDYLIEFILKHLSVKAFAVGIMFSHFTGKIWSFDLAEVLNHSMTAGTSGNSSQWIISLVIGCPFPYRAYSSLFWSTMQRQHSYLFQNISGDLLPGRKYRCSSRSFMTSMRSWKSSERSIKSAVISIRLQGI